MGEFRARIHRVRMKSGGADLTVLHAAEPPNPDGEDWRGGVVRAARTLGEHATEKAGLVGYLVVGMYADGMTAVGFRYDIDRCPIPRALMPSWLAEVVRRDMITDGEARFVFNEMVERI